jgi:hypothetical protein
LEHHQGEGEDEAETTLARLRPMAGVSISEVPNRGLAAYERQAEALDLGSGGYAAAPARDAKSAVSDAIRRKHRR